LEQYELLTKEATPSTTRLSLAKKSSTSLRDPVLYSPKIANQTLSAKSSEAVKYVYVVKRETTIQQSLPVLTERDQVIAIYATPEDASMKIYKMVTRQKKHGGNFEGYDVAQDNDGHVSWSVFDHGGRGNWVYLYVEKMEVQPSGPELGEGRAASYTLFTSRNA
jgi:hypothetical protein